MSEVMDKKEELRKLLSEWAGVNLCALEYEIGSGQFRIKAMYARPIGTDH
jgi:hypothetical protein